MTLKLVVETKFVSSGCFSGMRFLYYTDSEIHVHYLENSLLRGISEFKDSLSTSAQL